MPSLYNPLLTPPGLRRCYWASECSTEVRSFFDDAKAHPEQLNNPECIAVEKELMIISIEISACATFPPCEVRYVAQAESPHTITSGLLSHGDLNHD